MIAGDHISLFSGVGMTDLALEVLGYRTVATAEIDPWCRQLLQLRSRPGVSHFHDVRHVLPTTLSDYMQGGRLRRCPLLISGGFPCQGISAIGGRRGLSDKRSNLWSEFSRIINQFRPDKVLIENSPMLRSRGLDRVLCDLRDIQYDARWDCIPAASVGAPHLRDRIFIVAQLRSGPSLSYTDMDKPYLGVAVTGGIISREWLDDSDNTPQKYVTRLPRAGSMLSGFVVKETPQAPLKDVRHVVRFPTPRRAANEWRTTRNAPTHGTTHGKTLAGELNDLERAAGRSLAQSSESAGNINPAWVEWLMGLPQDWTDPEVPNGQLIPHPGWKSEPARVPRTLYPVKHRRARLAALGNGMVPAVAIQAMNTLTN